MAAQHEIHRRFTDLQSLQACIADVTVHIGETETRGLGTGADPELVVHISEAPPGQGMLDLDAFFEVVAHLGEDTAVIVEHLPPEQALEAIAYVKQAGEQRGFTFS